MASRFEPLSNVFRRTTLSREPDSPLPFLIRQVFTKLPAVPADAKEKLRGKTVLITGSNAGVGFEAARLFIEFGAKVILAVRSLEKGDKARDELLSHVPDASVEVRQLDMADFSSVLAFASQLVNDSQSIDISVLNAAVLTYKWHTAPSGYEDTLQVNLLSTALLALLLLPHMQKVSKDPRLLIVSSEQHAWTSFTERKAPNIIEALNNETNFKSYDRYALTKLLLILWTRHLCARLPLNAPKVILCSPGYCRSNLFHECKPMLAKFSESIYARPARDGATVYVNAALLEGELQGVYYRSGVVAEPVAFVRSDAGIKMGEKLWDEVYGILSPLKADLGDGLAE